MVRPLSHCIEAFGETMSEDFVVERKPTSWSNRFVVALAFLPLKKPA
jgi:hypothetical protein